MTDDRIVAIRARIEALEAEIEEMIEERRRRFNYQIIRNKARFEAEIRRHHRKMKLGLIHFFRGADVGSIVTAPIIYAQILPMALLDLFLFAYQHTCFRAYGIKRVRRADYIVIDRHHLRYLNSIEKLNCIYCAYANGLFAYAVEIASRTEQYWCPIKHAVRIKGAHRRYSGFVDYGDADHYQERLQALREKVRGAN